MIGESLRRIEDPVLLRGKGRFAADNDYPNQLHMRVIRSSVAHGRILSIDTSKALSKDSVHAVWTYADVSELPPIDFRLTAMEEMLPYRQPVLARERVRYVGEPVAVVFASSDYLAEDAAEFVTVEYETLPPVLDAFGDTTEWLDPPEATWASGKKVSKQLGSECAQIKLEYGDVDKAFGNAHAVISVDVRIGRHSGVPLECRGATAHIDPTTGVLIFDGAAKVPFWNRDAIAKMLNRAPQDVQLREGHVGGGFGPRGELYPEDVLVALATDRFGVPVKWVEDRQENLVATNHSRDQRHVLRAAVDKNGVILAVEAEFWTDQGAYVRTHAATVSSLTASMLPGPYLIENYRVVGHIRMSNKTPAGTYRSPGRYEGTFARERLIDQISHELKLDATEVRKRNFIDVKQMPYKRPIQAMGTELIYDSGDYAKLLTRFEKDFEIAKLRDQVKKRRKAGELVGLGFGWFVEKSGLGPFEGVRVDVDTSGAVTVTSGTSSVGQGVDTVLCQVVGDILGVPLEKIRAVKGQTDRFGYGRGAFATRQSVMAGSAALKAGEALREKALSVAAHEFEIDQSDLILRDGRVHVAGDESISISLGEIAARLEPQNAKAMGLEPSLTADGWFYTDHMTYPYGVHGALVSIDRGTGHVEIEKYFVGYDVGKALNLRLVEGQIVGGVAQGLGGALYEEFIYSDEGQPQASTFMDYLIPTFHEVPPVKVLVTEDAPSPLNPMGVKGAGEGGTTAVGACIASAVDDAMQQPGFIRSIPIRPEQIRSGLSKISKGK